MDLKVGFKLAFFFQKLQSNFTLTQAVLPEPVSKLFATVENKQKAYLG